MILKELKFKDNPLCICTECHGIGLSTYSLRHGTVGIICTNCHGNGFEEIPLNDETKLYIDEETHTIYKAVNGEIKENVSLFENLIIVPSIFKSVIHNDSVHFFYLHTEDDLLKFVNDISTSKYSITYRQFLYGMMPKSPYNYDTKKETFSCETNNYVVTDNEIVLEKLEIDNSFECNCPVCHGTGIEVFLDEGSSIGTVCFLCKGSGHVTKKLKRGIYIVKDTKSGFAYYVGCGTINKRAYLFDGLVVKERVKYVAYSNLFSLLNREIPKNIKDYFMAGISKDEIISYHKFLSGRRPLPMVKYTCPNYYLRNYATDRLNYDCYTYCPSGNFFLCSKFGTDECWEMFYGDAKTAGEKQAVLRKLLR